LLLISCSGRENIFAETEKSKMHVADGTNIILIVIDTLRADHLGVYGYSRNTSPNIDKLAKESIVFENAIAQSSWTRPGMASILTGLYPKNHGAITRDDRLGDDKLLLSEILQNNGYRTYAFVANGNCGEQVGFNQGYDQFFRFGERKTPSVHVNADEINKSLISFLKGLKQNTNNFIYIHYVDPHLPYMPHTKHFSLMNKNIFTEDRFQEVRPRLFDKLENESILKEVINAYDDEILSNDKAIGELLQALKDENMYEDSIIVITSDHGEEFMDHRNLQHGKTLYDEQLKVPLMIRLPSKIDRFEKKQVSQVDIVPSLLQVLGIRAANRFDGVSVFSDETRNPFTYAEHDRVGRTIFSIRSLEQKFIISRRAFDQEFNQTEGFKWLKQMRGFKWFQHEAHIELKGNLFEAHIASFYKKRIIHIFADDKLVKELTIKPKKEIIRLMFPTAKKRQIIIKSLAPCQRGIDVGKGKALRCLKFRLFVSSNFDISESLPGFKKEYYLLKDDPKEQQNLYQDPGREVEIDAVEKMLREYMSYAKQEPVDQRPIVFEPEQREALKALGYL